MKIQFLNGGLGNQVFQYVFVRYAQLHCPEETWYLDDSFFFVNNVHNGYELEKVFNIKPNLLSNYFDKDVWDEIIRLKREGTSIPQVLSDMGIPISMLAETVNYSEFNPFKGEIIRTSANEFCPEILDINRENIYYHGYWINKKWFDGCGEQIFSELAFPPLTDEKNKKYAEQINGCRSVGIHIRRGDYLSLGWDMPDAYYKLSCQQIINNWPDVRFFVFADDIAWCQEHSERLGFDLAKDTVYITGNVKGKNYIDMQLLSMCRGMIMSQSCFCYLAALLDRQLEFVINPTMRELGFKN